MPKLETPTVGPIVGHTTANQARIWLRGGSEDTGNRIKRCFCGVTYRPLDQKGKATGPWSAPVVNKMTLVFDMTAVVVLKPLVEGRLYAYRAVWFVMGEAEADIPHAASALASLYPDPESWPGQEYRLRTGSGKLRAPRSFAVGSCRYLLKLLGGRFFDERGDKTFGSIAREHAQDALHGLLMVGDQIYADDKSFLGADNELEEFFARYRDAFSQPEIRALMAAVPTYMILDDHEIEDNWPARATESDRKLLYRTAIHAYQVYQASHSPLFKDTTDGRISGVLPRLWYTFEDGCSEWFIMDSRTERVLLPQAPRMISEDQMKALLSWLGNKSKRVKFVVSSVPVFPDLATEQEDKWEGFPQDRLRILKQLSACGLRNVVFVSGDVHSSYVAQLGSSVDPNFRAFCVTSSSFFWPYPHMRPKAFAFGKPLRGEQNSEYVAKRLSKIHDEDNFARIDVSPSGFAVKFVDRKGKQLEKLAVKF